MHPAFERESFATTSTIRRRRLLDALEAARPRVALLAAAAGYGKSMLARQYAELFAERSSCDCYGVQGERELAKRILVALAQACPRDRSSLVRAQLLLGGSTPVHDVVVRAWLQDAPASVFVFENVERANGASRALLWRLLKHIPPHRTVVLCTRAPAMPPVRLGAPHEVYVLREDRLAFDSLEVREAFAGSGIGDELLERVAGASRGWPIAVLLFARFAREGRLQEILEHLPAPDLELLYAYLSEHVLGPLPKQTRAALFACALLPQASAQEIALALGENGSPLRVNALLHALPFVERTPGGGFTVHPLVQAGILAQYPLQRRAVLERTARALESIGNPLRAAQLHLARGDRYAAASALEAMDPPAVRASAVEYAAVLASIDRDVIVNYPRLWERTVLCRRAVVERDALLGEAQAIWRSRPATAPPAHWLRVLVQMALLLGEQGRYDEACSLVEHSAALFEGTSAGARAELGFAHACTLARIGEVAQALAVYDGACAGLPDPHLDPSVCARGRGLLQRALEGERLPEFAARAQREGLRAFALLAAAAGTGAGGRAYWDAWTNLFFASTARTAQDAAWYAHACLPAADACGNPLLRVLARLALAQVQPARVAALLDDAEATLRAHSREAPLRLALLEGTAHVGTQQLLLHGGERNLLLALAMRRRGIASEALVELLWPGHDEDSVRNRLYVAVHRLRRRLGMTDAIRCTHGVVRLGAAVRVDLWELQDAWAAPPGDETLESLVADAERHLGQTAGSFPDWFEPVYRQLQDAMRSAAARLGHRALEREAFDEAARWARAMLANEDCDETAWELLIRTHLRAGRPAEAAREYRVYRERLRSELDAQPSGALTQLVREST